MSEIPHDTAHVYDCSGCDTRWVGVSRCHCAGCHETFSGATSFTLHRRHGLCLDPWSVGLTDAGGIWRFGGLDSRWTI